MNAQEAQTFERKSQTHIAILEEVARERKCPCTPYESFLTYKRWQAVGRQVKRGERGICLTTYIKTKDSDGKERTRPWRSYVFCECQTEKME